MLIETLVLAVLVGYLTGGNLLHLRQVTLRWSVLLPLAVSLQLLIRLFSAESILLGYIPVIHILSYCILLLFAFVNINLPGMPLLASGVLLNGIAIALNGGAMPVDPTHLPALSKEALRQAIGTHGLLTETTRVSILADRFYISIPFIGKQLFSVGDILIDIGAFILVVLNMKRLKMSENVQCKAVTERDMNR